MTKCWFDLSLFFFILLPSMQKARRFLVKTMGVRWYKLPWVTSCWVENGKTTHI